MTTTSETAADVPGGSWVCDQTCDNCGREIQRVERVAIGSLANVPVTPRRRLYECYLYPCGCRLGTQEVTFTWMPGDTR